jgi:hypothetical protein
LMTICMLPVCESNSEPTNMEKPQIGREVMNIK